MIFISIYNIKDIAKFANVSVSTVSRVINNRPDVGDETRDKVNSIIKEYNFTPNSNAKNLKQRRTNNISVIIKGKNNALFHYIAEGIQNYMNESRYYTIFNYIDHNEDELSVASKIVQDEKPLGIIFLGANIDMFRDPLDWLNIPCLITTTTAKEINSKYLYSVSVDDSRAGEFAIDYLIKNGHRNIAIIGGNLENSYISRLRLEGCIKSFKKHNIDFNEKMYINCNFKLEEAFQKSNDLLADNKDITAIFAMSDIMAIGACKAILNHGLKIPYDISILGFDGIDLVDYFHPTIKTLVQPKDELIEKSAEMIIRAIEKNIPPQHVLLDVKVNEGESVMNLKNN